MILKIVKSINNVLGSQTENPESLPNTTRRKKTLFYYSAEQNTQKGYKGE